LSAARLSPLALRILRLLTTIRPPWRLAGRSALWSLQPQPLTDLDLAWYERTRPGSLSQEVQNRLLEADLEVTRIHGDDSSLCLRVTENGQTCRLRLIAEPGPPLRPSWRAFVEGLSIEIESPHEVFVDKLCLLLDRLDLQDLEDVCRLMKSGAELGRALAEAPRKLQDFSPLLLAENLGYLHVARLGLAIHPDRAKELESFKQRLISGILMSCFSNQFHFVS
jgi:hypothetical protein